MDQHERDTLKRTVARIESQLRASFPKEGITFVKNRKIARWDLPSWTIQYDSYEYQTAIDLSYEHEDCTFAIAFVDGARGVRYSGRSPYESRDLIADHFKKR